MKQTVTLPFIREEDGKVATLAVVTLGFRGPFNRSSQAAYNALVEAVGLWIRAWSTTKAGKTAWKYSGGEWNIGDLALHEVAFNKFLKANAFNLNSFNVVYCGEASEGSYSFDTNLAVDALSEKE
jgi:hypothetical protein